MSCPSICERYLFHHLKISVLGPPEFVAALHPRLGRFPAATFASPDLFFEFYSLPDQGAQVKPPPGNGRPFYDAPPAEFLYFEGENQLYLHWGTGLRISCDLERGHVQLALYPSDTGALRLATSLFFTILLMELFKHRGLYAIHAAGLSVGDKCLLFPGTSGAGKSTLTIALLRAGLGFLGDDLVWLAFRPDGLRVLAFPEQLGVTEETAALFPELHHLLNLPKRPGWFKHELDPRTLYGVETIWEGRPYALIFPQIAHSETSALEEMDRGQALLELAPNVLLTEPRSSQAQFDALAELVRQVQCFRLYTGRDWDTLPLMLRGLVEGGDG